MDGRRPRFLIVCMTKTQTRSRATFSCFLHVVLAAGSDRLSFSSKNCNFIGTHVADEETIFFPSPLTTKSG